MYSPIGTAVRTIQVVSMESGILWHCSNWSGVKSIGCSIDIEIRQNAGVVESDRVEAKPRKGSSQFATIYPEMDGSSYLDPARTSLELSSTRIVCFVCGWLSV